MRVKGKEYRSVWLEGSLVRMIDQRLLPHEFAILECPTYHDTAKAIVTMAVRGAGAIGCAAGYAMAQAALSAADDRVISSVKEAAYVVRSTRPTARNLFYALERVEDAVRKTRNPNAARKAAVEMSQILADENASAGERIGVVGEPLLKPRVKVMTQCNAGWLAFADWGSALAPIYLANRNGKAPFVYVPETRPRGQGARLTAWELGEEGIDHALIADTACGSFIKQGDVDCIIVGADRIAANGDVANKIGTYALALLAHHNNVPFYVAAPCSTFDPSTSTGEQIVIEERDEAELLYVSGRAPDYSIQKVRIAPETTRARNPAFDVTPAGLISMFITEEGFVPPRSEDIEKCVRQNTPSLPGCLPA